MNDEQMKVIAELYAENDRLERENNQLKEQKKELRSWLESYFKGMTINDIPTDAYYKKGMFRMNEYTLDKDKERKDKKD